jgi:outer membrane protein OmpA-like peptidoglycan-associated protein
MNRAKSVMQYLIEKGIATERLVAKGYGMTKPIESNKTAEGRALNRRTEVTILE